VTRFLRALMASAGGVTTRSFRRAARFVQNDACTSTAFGRPRATGVPRRTPCMARSAWDAGWIHGRLEQLFAMIHSARGSSIV
jgi:hypothetical protein